MILENNNEAKTEVKSQLFTLYYDMPAYRQKKFREDVMEQCGISFNTFHRWIRGYRVKKLYQEKIAEILDMPVLELFPITV